MNNVVLQVSEIRQVFQRRTVLSDINFSLSTSHALAITGRNGSGKSTLLKIIVGLLSPTQGNVQLTINERSVPREEMFSCLGFVAPYVQLYDEFSGWENLDIARKIRCVSASDEKLESLLESVGLALRKHDSVRTYSSGMKQRLKYAHALLHSPPILLLDEPSTNLDADGIQTVRKFVAEQKKSGIVIIATNVHEEVSMCDLVIDLDSLLTHKR